MGEELGILPKGYRRPFEEIYEELEGKKEMSEELKKKKIERLIRTFEKIRTTIQAYINDIPELEDVLYLVEDIIEMLREIYETV